MILIIVFGSLALNEKEEKGGIFSSIIHLQC